MTAEHVAGGPAGAVAAAEPSAGPSADPEPRVTGAPGGEPALAVAAVARRLGVAPSTLRTWDRRYGLGPSEHSAGSHRRYSTDDVARLLVMRQLTLQGVAPADAARAARQTDQAQRRGVGEGTQPGTRGADELATPALLVETAMRADELGCRRLLASVTATVETWWTDLVQPARAGLAARTVLAHAGEDAEWVLDSAALAVLRTRPRPRAAPATVGERVVLLHAAPRERRPLALHALAAALADRGVDARVVTGPVESDRMLELVAMTHPVAVGVISEQADPDLAIVGELSAAWPDLPLFVGYAPGRGAGGITFGQTVRLERSFLGLFHEILAVIG
ncbi:MerR family transcriptional regulator [Pengzhenrongella sicca]|uniref:MerR family transcriptional regulator n=2 Tax=Pengzhenrongella sicca TaxID=2819238 RepID=A0A8A4ZGV6_9MICO|nr:MerR family transcriptional regulator [Pengzhenrongella sicca]